METVEILNLSVKKLRSLIRKRCYRKDFQEFQLVQVGNIEKIENNTNGEKTDPRLQDLLENYSSVFCDDSASGITPKRAGDHAIETEPDAKPPNRPLYQLSPT